MRRWRLSMLLLGILSYGAGTLVGDYPWQLALLTSFAVVALAYSARRVYFEQRRLYRITSSWEAESEPEPPGSDDSSLKSSS